MKIKEEPKQDRLPHSNSPSRKKHYEAPKFTMLGRDQAKAQLVASAVAGDRDTERLLVLVSGLVSETDKNY
jgi:hypothetical protein